MSIGSVAARITRKVQRDVARSRDGVIVLYAMSCIEPSTRDARLVLVSDDRDA